jgi:hypothetical protein
MNIEIDPFDVEAPPASECELNRTLKKPVPSEAAWCGAVHERPPSAKAAVSYGSAHSGFERP